MPDGSVAHFQNSFLFSHGILKSPITTSSTKVPSGLGSLHFQQKPATSLDRFGCAAFLSSIAFFNSCGESKILNSIGSDFKRIAFCLFPPISRVASNQLR